jgi:uncharacterized protein YjgD (DUF1641 family)
VAKPIASAAPIRDPLIELQARLRDAPAEHADALLAGYEVLQGLHDAGVLDLMRGALGSRDKVLDIAVGAARSPASLRGIRNLLLLISALGTIEPEVLATVTETIPQALTMMVRQPEPPGLWTLIKDFLWNQDFRHGMAAINTLIEVLGQKVARRPNRPAS